MNRPRFDERARHFATEGPALDHDAPGRSASPFGRLVMPITGRCPAFLCRASSAAVRAQR